MCADVDRRGNGVADFVEQFADDWSLFLGERFHLLTPRRNAAAAAEIFYPRGFERLLVGGGIYFCQRSYLEILKRVRHETANVERSTSNAQRRIQRIVGQAHRLPF